MPDENSGGSVDSGLLRLAQAVRATGYAFITPTPATHARVNARPGGEWAEDLRGVFGWSRRFRDGLVPPPIHALMEEAGVLAREEAGWRSLVRFSSIDKMLFAHSAYPTLGADAVFFGPDTYRFARAIQALPERAVRRAVDIGCGAGPGAALIAARYPEAEVFAVDINGEALRMTRVNAAVNEVRLQALHSDLLAAVPGALDLIVANPPYLIDPAGRAYRHGGGALGAGLSVAILETALDRLAPGGTLLLYTGAAIVDGADPFRAEAEARLAGSRTAWTYEEVDPDVFGEELEGGVYTRAERIAAVVLTVTQHY